MEFTGFRWGHTPFDEARTFRHEDVVVYLLEKHAEAEKIRGPKLEEPEREESDDGLLDEEEDFPPEAPVPKERALETIEWVLFAIFSFV